MKYTLNNKVINIPDAEIEKNARILEISKDEAVQMWLEDEGYLTNDTVEALTEKAKQNKINHEAKSTKPRKITKRERKPDEEKEHLIELLSNCLTKEGISCEITNKSKIITFTIGENHYKLDLIKQRPPKN